jgi:hypothetical protein
MYPPLVVEQHVVLFQPSVGSSRSRDDVVHKGCVSPWDCRLEVGSAVVDVTAVHDDFDAPNFEPSQVIYLEAT